AAGRLSPGRRCEVEIADLHHSAHPLSPRSRARIRILPAALLALSGHAGGHDGQLDRAVLSARRSHRVDPSRVPPVLVLPCRQHGCTGTSLPPLLVPSQLARRELVRVWSAAVLVLLPALQRRWPQRGPVPVRLLRRTG